MSEPSTRAQDWVWPARLLAVCLALTAVAFRQQPGLVVADTKFDLFVSPWSFLGRALHLWDPQGAFGQLQNQAYGYLWPMGPFHGVLLSAGLPAWVVQRLWWSLLLCVAFLGFWKLVGGMRVGGPWARLTGAVLFALCPRIASELTLTSVEVWPMALAPWVLWPLVDRRERSWPWRIGLSVAAIAMCGGVNAVATGSVLVLPGLWFLTRAWTRRTFLLGGAWFGAAVVAMGWWLGPLILLGRYSPPFLDWIESAAVTSSTASPFEALRGTSAWLGFLATPLGPEWPGGWSYVTVPTLILATTLVAASGLVGVCSVRSPERPFLVTALVVGLGLMSLGWAGPFASLFADGVRTILDGPMAALRNAHKFDVVVRIPLLVGVVAVVSRLETWARPHPVPRVVHRLVTVAVVVSATAPSIAAGLARDQAFPAIPAYWTQAAKWLDAEPMEGAALVLPSSSFGDFVWGSTKDDPLQALTQRPVVVRDAVPLGSAGATRFLDGVVEQIGSGQAGPELVTALRSAGVGFVVVRNDLRPAAEGDPTIAVHAALESAGLTVQIGFGPMSADPLEDTETTIAFGTRPPRRMVEVYRVPGVAGATLTPVSSVVRAQGGPEDLPRLHRATGASTFVMGSDARLPELSMAPRDVLTDGLRRREVNFGKPTHNRSSVLAEGEAPSQPRPVTDYVSDPEAETTTTVWEGIRRVSASSSASDADASLRIGPSTRPAAAVDGDMGTRWVSGGNRGVGQWIQVDLAEPTAVRQAVLTFSDASPVVSAPRTVRVRTQTGERRVPTDGTLGPVFISLPPGLTSFVRITLEAVDGDVSNAFAIAELDLPGVDMTEQLALPVPERQPDQIVLGAGQPGRIGCLPLEDRTFCSPTLELTPEGPAAMERRVSLPESGSFRMSGTVRARPGRAADALLSLPGVSASASSQLVAGLLDRPESAMDGNQSTAWVASRTDFSPSMTITLPEEQTLSGLEFRVPPRLAASRPKAVTVIFNGDTTIRGTVNEDGVLEFPRQRVRSLRIDFGATYPLTNLEAGSGVATYAPVGFAELRLVGAETPVSPRDPSWSTGSPCGFGPVLTVAGQNYQTRVSGSVGELLAGRPLTWTTCTSDTVWMPQGMSDISATPSAEFAPESLILTSSTSSVSPTATVAVSMRRASAGEMALAVPTRDEPSVVSVPQNFNSGWTATVRGERLTPVRVNGWMQGWAVPAGNATELRAQFTPDRPFSVLLLVGVLLVFAALGGLGYGARIAGRVPGELPLAPSSRAAIVLSVTAGALAWTPFAAALALGLGFVLRRAEAAVRPAMAVGAGALPLLAALFVAHEPWPGGHANHASWIVQGGVLLAVVVTSALALQTRGSRAPRLQQRHGGDPSA